MNVPFLGGIFKVAEGLIGLADQAITDKDKKIEFQYKVLERTFQFYENALNQKTVPWVDATVKFILVGKEFFRPIGAFLLTAGAAYLRYKGQPLPEYLEIPLAAAFPGWMASRHAEKKRAPESDIGW